MKISAGKSNVLALIVMMLESLSGFAICPLCPSGSVKPSVLEDVTSPPSLAAPEILVTRLLLSHTGYS